MSVNCGIIGLPNVGKSTLFNALTRAGAAAANYPFCTVDPNVGIVEAPDERLDRLAAIYHPKKVTRAHMEFVDIAGLVAGASRGEGLGNQFLGHIREVDALIHVVRCFDDPEIVHVSGAVDPQRDIEIIETELILKDLDSVEKRAARTEKKAKSGEKESIREMALLARLKEALSKGISARAVSVAEAEAPFLKEMALLTAKPILYVANVPEEAVEKGNDYSEKVSEIARREGAGSLAISGKIESEIALLPPEEGALFLKEIGLAEPGLNRLIRA
ncbi:MAG TPA: redox-regulated ATPase YchF, partial [Candidatus Manganitrophaceae bacterium]|nr:redox-regulated ATPase YchF [Candidatus Manganitrophaceae bacterium]